jgi:hypothetical protein
MNNTRQVHPSYLVHVIGKLPLRDGPRPLVVALESCNLLPQDRGARITCAQHQCSARQASGYIGLGRCQATSESASVAELLAGTSLCLRNTKFCSAQHSRHQQLLQLPFRMLPAPKETA